MQEAFAFARASAKPRTGSVAPAAQQPVALGKKPAGGSTAQAVLAKEE